MIIIEARWWWFSLKEDNDRWGSWRGVQCLVFNPGIPLTRPTSFLEQADCQKQRKHSRTYCWRTGVNLGVRRTKTMYFYTAWNTKFFFSLQKLQISKTDNLSICNLRESQWYSSMLEDFFIQEEQKANSRNHLWVLEIRLLFLNIKTSKLWRKTGKQQEQRSFWISWFKVCTGGPSQPQSLIKVRIVHPTLCQNLISPKANNGRFSTGWVF